MRDAPSRPPITMRYSLVSRLGNVVVSLLIAVLLLFMIGVSAVAVADSQPAVAAIVMLTAVVMTGLLLYVLRETRGKLGWRVRIGDDGIDLELPAGRSITRRLASVHRHLRYDEIDAVEVRIEAYPSVGLVNLQRCDALRLKDGSLIILGEDRALNTAFATSLLADTVERIVRAGHLEVRDRGMGEGRGGILGVLRVVAPPWDAPSPTAERQAGLWLAAGRTGRLAETAAYVSVLSRR